MGLIAVAWAALAALAVVLAPPAAAHAELIDTNPRDGQRVEQAPPHVHLRFTEPVRLARDGIRLINPDGRRIATPPPRAEGKSVLLPLPGELPAGGYVVAWRVVSGDTHPVSGAFSFGVRAEPARATAQENAPEPAAGVLQLVAAGRWLSFGGLALLLGGTTFLALCWPAGRELAPVRRLVWLGWALATVAAALAVPVHSAFVSGRGLLSALSPGELAEAASTQYGLANLTRVALLVAFAFLLRPLLRPSDTPRISVLVPAGLLAAGMALTHAITGHSASGTWRMLALISDSVHLSSTSLWAGGLVFLATYALRPRHMEGLGTGLARFSRLATTVVLVLVITGIFQAWRTVGSFEALLSTTYGHLLLAKLALVAVVFGIGALSMLAVRGGRPAAVRRTAPWEVAVVLGVLAVTSVLVITQPARQAEAPRAAGPQHTVVALPEDRELRVHLTPAVAGANQLHISVHKRTGKPLAVAGLSARASLPTRDVGPVDVRISGRGAHFLGEVWLPFAAQWRFDVTVRTSDLDAHLVSTSLRVATASRR